jgi:hypothetical protein
VSESFSQSNELIFNTIHSLVISELKVEVKKQLLFQMESLKQVVQPLIAVVSCRQEGIPASDPCEAENHSLNFSFQSPSNEAEPVCLVGNSKQKLGELTDKEAETPQFPDHCAEPVSEVLVNVDKSFMTPLLLRSHLH